MKNKKKEQLLVDKKECSNCGGILEKDIKVCDECGYDMTMEESFMIYVKKYAKIIKEQVNPNNPTIIFDKTTNKVSKPGAPVDMRSLKPGSYTVSVTDEGKKTKKKKYKYTPWAVCTASVGREDKEKYEKCVMDVKNAQKMHEDLGRLSEYIERLITDSEVNPKIKKGNFKQFVSKLK